MLNDYQEKRNFLKTQEPKGKVVKRTNQLEFVIHHHLASHDHFDLRLEWNGVLISFAVPKGLPIKAKSKRLAVKVEDHPYAYRNFEGTIPKGEYGGGTVMIYDYGLWTPLSDVSFKNGFKFRLFGKRLKGYWALVPFKDDFLLIKEDDGIVNKTYNRSVKTGRTMREIGLTYKTHNDEVAGITITNSDKDILGVSKLEIAKYYNEVFLRCYPFMDNKILSEVRMPNGSKFFMKHFPDNRDLLKVGNFYSLKNKRGLIYEVQMNGYEFHLGGGKPDVLKFDLDPDEGLSLKKLRSGVLDVKKVLDKLGLKSYLAVSGGKGYHIYVPISSFKSWKSLFAFAKMVACFLEEKYPDKYTTSMSKKDRQGKIFVDYYRNKRESSCVCPYTIRLKDKITVSMPIRWSELDKVKPDGIDIEESLKRLKKKDPWFDFFFLDQ